MMPIVKCTVLVLTLILLSHVAVAAAPSLATDTVPTPEGRFLVWHRTPAQEIDLEMPMLKSGAVHESFAYRVRDRKMRDLLYFVRVRLTTSQPAAEVKAFYVQALGKDTAEEMNTATGEITLVRGVKDNFRMVVITVKPDGCEVRLERVQQYTIPPRVFTAQEQRILRVLEQVSAHYRSAPRVSYTMEQRAKLPPEDQQAQQPPVLSWNVSFTRPAQLAVTASAGGVVGLQIITEQGALQVRPQVGKPETRAIEDAITLENVPELEDDPVAGLMLGNPLVNDALDYFTMQAVPGVPSHQQAEIILTYPDWDETLYLIVDLQRKTILRSETVLTHEGSAVSVIRTYTNTVDAATPQPTPKPARPAAVTGP